MEQSRQFLGRDILDIVTLHLPDDDETILRDNETIDTLLDLQAKGIIGKIGASTKTVVAGKMAAKSLDLVMIALSGTKQNQRPVLEAAAAAEKGVLVKKPLDSGHAKDAGSTLGDLVCQKGVTTVVTGTINPRHLHENIASVRRALID